jgi:hypothetical protein
MTITIIGETNRRTNYNPNLAEKLAKKIEEDERQKELEEKLKKKELKEEKEEPIITTASARYEIIDGETYAKAVQKLRDMSAIPFTFKQNIEARVSNYNTLENLDGSKRTIEERLLLFNISLDSCTGIVNKAYSSRFKIIPYCLGLINIMPVSSNIKGLLADYEKTGGDELFTGWAKYDNDIIPEDVITHPAWLASLENDKELLKKYVSIYFKEFKKQRGMGFWVSKLESNEELRPLYLHSGKRFDNSGAYQGHLNDHTRFLRLKP